MSIACILGGKGVRRTKTRGYRDQSPTSIAMDGNATAEVFITRQWLPDSPKNSCSLWHMEDIGRQTTLPMKPFAIGACKRGAVGRSLFIPPSRGAFRNRGSPQLASALTAEISQSINSPPSGVGLLIGKANYGRWTTKVLAYNSTLTIPTRY